MRPFDDRRPSIEVTGRAREALLAHVAAEGEGDGRKRYVRIHVGRG